MKIIMLILVCLLEINLMTRCNDYTYCEKDETCCRSKTKSGFTCCSYPKATCCEDGYYCCPSGYKCNNDEGYCSRMDGGNDFLSYVSLYKTINTILTDE
jgi:hypothetical protein